MEPSAKSPWLGAMYVMVAVGVQVVISVIGPPADRTPLRGTTADHGQDVFEPPGPGDEAAVSQQAMVTETNTDAAGQPV